MPRLSSEDAEERQARDLGGANPADYSEALARGLAVLQAFTTDHARMTQADVARRLNLPRPTVRRAVMTLVHLGFLEAEGRTYRLTPKVLNLATAYLTSNPVSLVIQPVCEQLCARLESSCTAAVLEGQDAVMVARALPRGAIGVGSGIGFRIPAAASALGRVLLAEYGTEQLQGFLLGTGQFSSPDDPELRRIMEAIAEVRQGGHAYVAHEVEAGFHSVAVPLRRWDGKVVAALNIGSTIERLSHQEMTGPVLDLLRDTAETLRAQLL
jgi:IclR family transcriptional regulator, pca regulon regulatory protein